MSEKKQQDIKNKINVAENRNASREKAMLDRIGEKAIEAKDGVARFAREHPVLTVAGALAAGVAISALFKQSPTRRLARKLGERSPRASSGLAAMLGQFALSQIHSALSAASTAGKAGANRLDELGDHLGHSARDLRSSAKRRAAALGDNANIARRKAEKSVNRAIKSIHRD